MSFFLGDDHTNIMGDRVKWIGTIVRRAQSLHRNNCGRAQTLLILAGSECKDRRDGGILQVCVALNLVTDNVVSLFLASDAPSLG